MSLLQTNKHENLVEINGQLYIKPRITVSTIIMIEDSYNTSDDLTCCCCYEDIDRSDILTCSHSLCQQCANSLETPTCPICRKNLHGENITNEVLMTIRRRQNREIISDIISKNIIMRIVQRTSLLLCLNHFLSFNIVMELALVALYGYDPLEFVDNKLIHDDVCQNMINTLLEKFPTLHRKIDIITYDVVSCFQVLDIDMLM